jgi:hypothetical protein
VLAPIARVIGALLLEPNDEWQQTCLGIDEKSFGKGHDYVSALHDVVV